mmetsp:Transcript_59451/g.156494  ORF Transcript_59451/g.156494 Transcript_59451/m.156494 type:complete len:111 (-) Transcript_59451:14-346(-)
MFLEASRRRWHRHRYKDEVVVSHQTEAVATSMLKGLPGGEREQRVPVDVLGALTVGTALTSAVYCLGRRRGELKGMHGEQSHDKRGSRGGGHPKQMLFDLVARVGRGRVA